MPPTIGDVTTTLITGANRGLGRETARRLAAEGHDVWIGARDAGAGRAAAEEVGARHVVLDVTDDASVAAAARTLGDAVGALDVLVNNAAIPGPLDVEATTVEDLRRVLEVGLLGALRTTSALLPLLRAAEAGAIVNVSSELGSIGAASDPEHPFFAVLGAAYPPTKAALNMLTVQWAKAFPELRVNAVDPGWTATAFTDGAGPQTVEEGAERIVEMALLGGGAPTGTFSGRSGPLPW